MGHKFSSSTDTEVILSAYKEWGEGCLGRFNGMWAFAIWDAKKKELFCARDRFGVKPFYYFFDGKVFAFASEIKSLLYLGIPRKPNDTLIYDFLHYGILDHTDDTFFQGIQKLPASHWLKVKQDGRLITRRYWDFAVCDKIADNHISQDKYAEDFLQLFIDSVRIRLRSDVAVGSCLSGGLDSSSVVCVINNLLHSENIHSLGARQKTFSACFDDKGFDEREYIEEVVKKTAVEKNYIFPSPEGFLKDLDNLLWHQEEPFAAINIYTQWEVLKEAKTRGVTVILDGQGGDENLCGYRKFHIFYLNKLLLNDYRLEDYQDLQQLPSGKAIQLLYNLLFQIIFLLFQNYPFLRFFLLIQNDFHPQLEEVFWQKLQ